MATLDIRQRLKAASRSGDIVRIKRTQIERWHFDAYGVGAEWTLLAPIRDRIDLDGYDVLRIEDVTSVRASPRAEFYEKALRLKKQTPLRPEGVELRSTRALLRSAGKRYRLLVIHRERVDKSVCEVGQYVVSDDSCYVLHGITPDAVMHPEVTEYRLEDVTRVQFAGSYENTLAMVAGRTP